MVDNDNEVAEGEMPPPPPAPINLALRFNRDSSQMVRHLRQVKANVEMTPSAESRLLATLEYVLVGISSCRYHYELIEDEGWPVPRVYDHVPRAFSLFGHRFTVSIINGTGSIKYVLFKNRKDSFRLSECVENMIPTFDIPDTDTDIRKVHAIHGTVSSYLEEYDQIGNPPGVRLFERELLNFTAISPQQLENSLPVIPVPSYVELYAYIENANFNEVNRLYRTIVFIFHQTGAKNAADLPNWHSNLVPNYTGEAVHVSAFGIFFYYCLVPDVDQIFLVIKDSALNFIYGYGIPNDVIPVFMNTPCDIFNDTARIQALAKFLGQVLKIIQRSPTGPRSGSTSTSIFDLNPAPAHLENDPNYINL